jgi:hypothetical protein
MSGRAVADVRYWLGVVSLQHVERGVAGGFAQLCHGRASPLRRMRAGDWLIYYSPRIEMDRESARVQAFTALGRLVDDRVYEHDLGGGWVPHRRDVAYERVRPVALDELRGQLHLLTRSGWAMMLRRGHLELDAHDFARIAAAMRAPKTCASRAELY